MEKHEETLTKNISIICLLTLAALLIRLLLLNGVKIIDTDSVQYLTLAKNIIMGKGYLSDGSQYPDIIRPPLYPILIGLFQLIVGDLELAGSLVSIVMGSLMVPLIFIITNRLFGKVPAIISSIVIMVHPVLTDVSISAVTDATFAFFLGISVFLGWLSINNKRGTYFLLTGAAFGLSYLSRQVGILFFTGYVIFAILWLKIDRASDTSKFRNITVLLVGFLVFFMPYMVWVRNYTGMWMEPAFKFTKIQSQWEGEITERLKENKLPGEGLTGEVRKYEALHHGLSDDGKEIMLFQRMERPDRARYSAGPAKLRIRNIAYNLYAIMNLGIPGIFPTFSFFFIVFGFIGEEWSKINLKKHIYLGFLFLISILFVLLARLELRYLAPSIIIGSIWIGNGVKTSTHFLNTLTKKSTKERYFILIFALLIIGSLLPGVYRINFKEKEEPVEEKKAGLWLRINRPHSIIISRKPQISYYAAGRYVVLPFASYKDIMEFGRVKKANILVVDERYIPSTRPELVGLLREIEVPKGLKLVYKDDEVNGATILLYEMRDSSR